MFFQPTLDQSDLTLIYFIRFLKHNFAMAQIGIESRLELLEDVAAGFDLVIKSLKQSDCPELFDLVSWSLSLPP